MSADSEHAGISDATPAQVLAVVEQMVDLPWPEGEETRAWRIAGLEGYTTSLLHLLPLAAATDAARVTAWARPLIALADRRWRLRYRFDATRHTDDAETDPAEYDLRSAPAAAVRSLAADHGVWWPLGDDAAMLVVGETGSAAILVLPAQWLAGSALELGSAELADIRSGDRTRILSAVWKVIGTRDPATLRPLADALPEVRAVTDDVDLGGALASNRTHLDHALERLGLFDRGMCLCAAYLGHQFYDPDKEAERGHVRIIGTLPNDQQWVPDRICVCRDCDRRFQVEQGEYHYTWWRWVVSAAR